MKTLRYLLIPFFLVVCHLVNANTIRDYYEEPGINPFKHLSNQDFVENVDTFSGMLQIGLTSIFIPGNGGFDLTVRHAYATPSTGVERTAYGYGWNLHFGRIVTSTINAPKICTQSLWSVTTSDNPSLELPDGSRQLLVLADYHSPYLITKEWWSAECVTGGMIVKAPDGTQYHMNYTDSAGDVQSIYATYIEDANGNSMEIDYATNPTGVVYIESITTSDGRSVEFSYDDVTTADIRLSQIQANGQVWGFDYVFPGNVLSPAPQLARVTRPDNLDWIFHYKPTYTGGNPGELAIQKITYPSGGEVEYTYDYVLYGTVLWNSITTVVTSKATSGPGITPGLWTYNYVPGHSSGTGYDETTIYTPDGIQQHYYYGYTSVGSGNVWATGLKAAERLYTNTGSVIEQIQYNYATIQISNENFWHGRDNLRVDAATYIPLLSERIHYRESRGTTTTYSNFNSYGDPQAVVETSTTTGASNREKSYVYSNDPSRWILRLVLEEEITRVTDAPVDTWLNEYTYDTNGNLLTESKLGVLTTYTYTTEGDVSTVTDANNNTTTYSNYYRGTARSELLPEGVSISRTVNDSGTLASVTDPRGYVYSYSWDGLNRLTGIDYPINADVSVDYYADRKELSRGNFKETITMDGFGRDLHVKREDVVTLDSIEVTKTRDGLGRVVFQSYPNSSNGMTTQYDEYNRVVREVHADGADRVYAYPNASDVVITDENDNVTTKRYTHIGTMTGSEELDGIYSPEGINTLIARNGIGQIWRVFQGAAQSGGGTLGLPRYYRHNSKGLLIEEEHPETGVTIYTYDAMGNLLTKEVGISGIIETFAYDDLNRLETVSYSDLTPSVTYQYDDASNVISIDNTLSARAYAYDQNGNLTAESLSIGGREYEVTYGVDALDFINTVTYPSSRVVTYSPNALGRATAAAPYITKITHHPNGMPALMTLANGLSTNYSQDVRQRLSNINTGNISGDIVDLTYSYDDGFNVASIVDGIGTLHDRTLTYDGINRLSTAAGLWGNESLIYDAMSNIEVRNRNGIYQEYYYNNMLLTYRVFPTYFLNVTHDDRGNVTSDGIHYFDYSGNGRLTTAYVGTASINYQYDGAGMRTLRSDATSTTHYLYTKSGLLLGEYNPAGGYDEYVYVGTKPAAKINEDTAIVGVP